MYFYTHLLLMRRCILVRIYYGNRCFYTCQSTIIISLIHIRHVHRCIRVIIICIVLLLLYSHSLYRHSSDLRSYGCYKFSFVRRR